MKTLNEWRLWVAALLVAEFFATGLAWYYVAAVEAQFGYAYCTFPNCWTLWLARYFTLGLGLSFFVTVAVVLSGLVRINIAMYRKAPHLEYGKGEREGQGIIRQRR